MIKSPLRYPGGKSRLAEHLLKLMPEGFTNYCEPFLGGGSVMLAVAEKMPEIHIVGADIDDENINFWATLRINSTAKELIAIATHIRTLTEEEIRKLCNEWRRKEKLMPFEYYILNQCSFSGTIRKGGLGPGLTRFTQSKIDRLLDFQKLLERKVELMVSDYRTTFTWLELTRKNTFFFLDPPYLKAKGLYKHGDFDHYEFAERCKLLKSNFLLTLDDCPEVRNLFSWANIKPIEFTYSMNNCNLEKTQKVGKELVITNY